MTTPATVTLADWLMAQIEDDEAVAREATSGPWEAELAEPGMSDVIGPWRDNGTTAPHVVAATDADATHIARHDPDRVLAECAAKRRITEDHQPDGTPCRVCVGGFSGHDRWPCPTIRALASIYSDRPGFREEWRA